MVSKMQDVEWMGDEYRYWKLTQEEKASCREARRSTSAHGFMRSGKAEELSRSKGGHHRGYVAGEKH
jgi:hypothetical protein